MSEHQQVSNTKHAQPVKNTGQPEQVSSSEPAPTAFDQNLSPAQILKLQSTIGNHAVTQLVKRRTAARKIQRAVGFEFESGAWTSFQQTDSGKETVPLVNEKNKGKEKDDEKGKKKEEEVKDEGTSDGLAFGDLTFAYERIIPYDEGLGNADVIKLFQAFPGLKEERNVQISSRKASAMAELRNNVRMSITSIRASPLGDGFPRVDAELVRFYKLFSDIGIVFVKESPVLDKQGELTSEVRIAIAEMMSIMICSTLRVISPKDMNAETLALLRKQFGGTNIYSTLEPEGKNINQVPKVAEQGLQAAGKKGALHTEKDFKIEADGPYEQGRMDIEFVTSPFEETKAGLKDLEQVMKRIRVIMKDIGTYAPADYTKGVFVTPPQNRFNAGNVFLGGGSPTAGFKMQATKGIPLSDIPILMKYLGNSDNHAATESKTETKEREHSRRLMRGDDTKASQDTKSLDVSPGLADTVLRLLINPHRIFSETDDLSALRGLVSYMLFYIVQLNHAHPEGIKMRLPLMSRFSFSALFGQLPKDQQKVLSANTNAIAHAINQVLSGYLKDFTLHTPLVNFGPLPNKYTRGGHQAFFDLFKKLSVRDWIYGIVEDGVDRLTVTGMKDHLKQVGEDTAAAATAYDKSLSIYLRGHANADNLVGKVDGLAIMENRDINPLNDADMSVEQTEEAAIAYLTFLINIKNAKGKASKVGAFSKLKKI